MTPNEIEAQSFSIIDTEAGPHAFSSDEWQIVRRMIHTSADFDYMKTVRFHPDAITKGIQAIRDGKPSSQTPPWPRAASMPPALRALDAASPA